MNYHTNVSNKFHEYNQEKKKKMQAEGLDLWKVSVYILILNVKLL